MNKKLVFLLDVDDTLMHCNDMAVKWLNKEYKSNHTIEEITDWGILHSPLDQRLKYFSDRSFVAAQKPYDGAERFVEELRHRGEVFFVTDIPADMRSERVKSLEKYFKADAGHIITGSAKFLLKADFLLDDRIRNIVGTATHKMNVNYPILMRRPWNASATGLLTISNYKEALALIDYIISPGTYQPKTLPRVCSLVGASGSGKNDIANKLCERSNVCRISSYSTNPLASASHKIISKQEFLHLKEEDYFFETSCYLGEYYGTVKSDIDKVLSKGNHALLVMDINGAIAMKAAYPTQAISVFVERDKEQAFLSVIKESNAKMAAKQLYSWEMESTMSEFCDTIIHYEANWVDELNVILP